MSPHWIGREEALSFRQGWSIGDLRLIEENFERLGIEKYYSIPSGSYVGCVDTNGTRVMSLAPGFVWFKTGLQPEYSEPDWPGFVLSTFRSKDSPNMRSGKDYEVCPEHPTMTLPLSGICEECG